MAADPIRAGPRARAARTCTLGPVSAGPSLYRRHRPRTFADVVGQEHVVRTLRNAVEQGKVHHAYLFVGSRGTGKTSMAKILAACLNCEHGPTIEPCGVCESCVAIQNATSLDVIEMDAASQQLGRRHPRAARQRRVRAGLRRARRSTSSTRRTCSRRRRGTRSSRRSRSRRRTRSSCSRRPRRRRCCRRSSTAATASTSGARRSSSSSVVLRRVADQEQIEIAPDAARAARPPRDRLVPRRARHARAARHLLGHARSPSTTCWRCSASPTTTCCSARSTRSPRTTPARRSGGGAAGRDRPRPAGRRARPRGPRARAARRAHAGRAFPPSCASRPSATRASPSRPRRVDGGRPRPAARPARRRRCAR